MAKENHEENIEQGAYYLNDAPIAELADYAGVSIDEAVKMRIAAALAEKPLDMEVTVRPIEPKGNLLGFASVKFGSGVAVDDFKIVENKGGELFVGMPSKPDKGSKTGYRNTVRIDGDLKEAFSAKVLDEYYLAVEQTQNRAANLRSAPEKESIPKQLAKGAEQAAKDNAVRQTASVRSAPAKDKAKNAER